MRLAIILFVLILTTSAYGAPYLAEKNGPMVSGVRSETLLSGLEHPWGMVWLPDGSLLISLRGGEVLWYRNGEVTPVPGAPRALVHGQGGLLDISLHPDFGKNGWVYFTLATGTPDKNATGLARAVFADGRFQNAEVLFRAQPAKSGGQHFGSRMVWLPDHTLLMSVGDGGNPPQRVDGILAREMAQKKDSLLGKIVHLNEDGEPVGTSVAGAADAVYTLGHRNVQGLAWDSVRKVVWASEHGARGGDEINRIEGGGNYGWPEASHSREYHLPLNVAERESWPGMVDPVLVWEWRFAPSGLCVYTGSKFANWKGALLAGGLRSRCIQVIALDRAGRVSGVETIDMSERVRDVRQGPDGYVYVLTDASDGRLIRLVPDVDQRSSRSE